MRRVGGDPLATSFKPRGIPSTELEEVTLSLDEFEAIRLADWEGLYQEDAAARMGVSRQTFGNIIAAAHKKIADFLIHGKHLLIEGGPVTQQAAADHVERGSCCRGRERGRGRSGGPCRKGIT